MTNGHFDFELEGVKYSLRFGMTAVQIFFQKSAQQVKELAEENPGVPLDELKADNVKSFAYLLYAGLCNYADSKEQKRPTFEDAYNLTESVLTDAPESLQKEIFDCYSNSRATVSQNEKLGIKSVPEDEKKKKRTGTQSKPTLTEL